MKDEAEVWKVINKKRGKSNWVKNTISKESWENYFTELLGKEEVEIESGRERSKIEEARNFYGCIKVWR